MQRTTRSNRRKNRISALVVHRNKFDYNFDLNNVVLIKRESKLLRRWYIESALIFDKTTTVAMWDIKKQQ